MRAYVMGGILAIALTGAMPAAADDPGGPYDALSSGNKQIVESLHFFQEPPDGSDPLTQDQLAALKTEGGWGKIFQNLKADGYFDGYRNLGAVISSWNHERIGLHKDGPGAAWKRSEGPSASASLRFGRPASSRPVRVQRTSRPMRPARPARPPRRR